MQVLKFEFLKFRILEILNFHPCIKGEGAESKYSCEEIQLCICDEYAYMYVHTMCVCARVCVSDIWLVD